MGGLTVAIIGIICLSSSQARSEEFDDTKRHQNFPTLKCSDVCHSNEMIECRVLDGQICLSRYYLVCFKGKGKRCKWLTFRGHCNARLNWNQCKMLLKVAKDMNDKKEVRRENSPCNMVRGNEGGMKSVSEKSPLGRKATSKAIETRDMIGRRSFAHTASDMGYRLYTGQKSPQVATSGNGYAIATDGNIIAESRNGGPPITRTITNSPQQNVWNHRSLWSFMDPLIRSSPFSHFTSVRSLDPFAMTQGRNLLTHPNINSLPFAFASSI